MIETNGIHSEKDYKKVNTGLIEDGDVLGSENVAKIKAVLAKSAYAPEVAEDTFMAGKRAFITDGTSGVSTSRTNLWSMKNVDITVDGIVYTVEGGSTRKTGNAPADSIIYKDGELIYCYGNGRGISLQKAEKAKGDYRNLIEALQGKSNAVSFN